MGIFNYNSSIITHRRKGTSEDPFINKTETFTIKESKAMLSEIPDYFYHVQVTEPSTNKVYYEIFDDSILDSTHFKVDYSLGYIEFSSTENNKNLQFIYKGTGASFFPANRIWTKIDDSGNILETLQDIIDLETELRNGTNVDGFTTVTSVSNIFTCDLSLNSDFYINITNTTAKTIAFSNVQNGLNTVGIKINFVALANITYPSNNWINVLSPIVGHTYYVLFTSTDSGVTWTISYF